MQDSFRDEFESFLDGDGEVLVASHIYPDGDAIGSLLAFGGILDLMGKKHTLVIDDYSPFKYGFMPGFDKVVNLKLHYLDRVFDRAVILDAGAIQRIGGARRYIDGDARILNIDHHFTGVEYGDLNKIDVNASATCELLYDLCLSLDLEITTQIAYGIYVGIITDTGRFRFSNTNARSLEICGELVRLGVSPGLVTENVFFNMSYESVKSLALGLGNMELYHNGMVSMIALEHDKIVDDTEGFADFASSVKGVIISVFISGMNPNVYKVSLRSRCRVDVSEIAKKMGGGGHRKAAGFRYEGSLRTLSKNLIDEIGRVIQINDIQPEESIFKFEPVDRDSSDEWIVVSQ